MVHKVRPVKIPVKPTTPSSDERMAGCDVLLRLLKHVGPSKGNSERGWAITPIYVPFVFLVSLCCNNLSSPSLKRNETWGLPASHFSCLLHPLSGRKINGRNLAQRGQGALTKQSCYMKPTPPNSCETLSDLAWSLSTSHPCCPKFRRFHAWALKNVQKTWFKVREFHCIPPALSSTPRSTG